jgi:hypothetical protein
MVKNKNIGYWLLAMKAVHFDIGEGGLFCYNVEASDTILPSCPLLKKRGIKIKKSPQKTYILEILYPCTLNEYRLCYLHRSKSRIQVFIQELNKKYAVMHTHVCLVCEYRTSLA